MTAGTFRVGAFDAAAQIFDRQNVIVELSPEKENDFIKNKVTIRCEERLVLSMKQPLAPITGSCPNESHSLARTSERPPDRGLFA